ncbi:MULTISPECIES: winged helix-turn-helix domain-containing protein [Lachnospiraceae]
MLLDMLRNDPTITQKEIIERVSLSRSTVGKNI